MSNPRAKAERSKAKNTRQGITEQKPVSSNQKKKIKFVLWGRYTSPLFQRVFSGQRFKIGGYEKRKAVDDAFRHYSSVPYYTDLEIEEL